MTDCNCNECNLDDSILESVKADIGAMEWDNAFDGQLIRDINAVFMILNQLGVGPTAGFQIASSAETWDDYETNGADVGAVRTYVSKKVKLMFDPASSSFVNDSDKQICSELEWRLNVAVDPG